MTRELIARSASDKTDDWPFWMVWNGSLNVTGPTARSLGIAIDDGVVFAPRPIAEALAAIYNKLGPLTCDNACDKQRLVTVGVAK